jgi:hypothetical protein
LIPCAPYSELTGTGFERAGRKEIAGSGSVNRCGNGGIEDPLEWPKTSRTIDVDLKARTRSEPARTASSQVALAVAEPAEKFIYYLKYFLRFFGIFTRYSDFLTYFLRFEIF